MEALTARCGCGGYSQFDVKSGAELGVHMEREGPLGEDEQDEEQDEPDVPLLGCMLKV